MNAENLRSKLGNNLLPASVLLGKTKLLDNTSRDTPAFDDPLYFPFYYHLGQETNPKEVHQIGVKLGLIAACFMQGCINSVEWTGMEPFIDGVPPMNIINSNMKMFYKGQLKTEYQNFCFGIHPNNLLSKGDPNYSMEMALVTDRFSEEHTKIFLEFFWKYLRPEGLLVVDYIHDEAIREVFMGFCRVKNREPQLFNTRYGVGIVTR